MKSNVIELPAGRIRRDTAVNRRKQSMDQDLFVNMVEADPRHIARRKARRDAYYAAMRREKEETDSVIRLLIGLAAASLVGLLLAVVLH